MAVDDLDFRLEDVRTTARIFWPEPVIDSRGQIMDVDVAVAPETTDGIT